MWRSVFLCLWHYILNANSTKTPSSVLLFSSFAGWVFPSHHCFFCSPYIFKILYFTVKKKAKFAKSQDFTLSSIGHEWRKRGKGLWGIFNEGYIGYIKRQTGGFTRFLRYHFLNNYVQVCTGKGKGHIRFKNKKTGWTPNKRNTKMQKKIPVKEK